jgi:hypothetical protein
VNHAEDADSADNGKSVGNSGAGSQSERPAGALLGGGFSEQRGSGGGSGERARAGDETIPLGMIDQVAHDDA